VIFSAQSESAWRETALEISGESSFDNTTWLAGGLTRVARSPANSVEGRLAQQLQDIELARASLSEWVQVDPANTQLKKMLDELDAVRRQ
jgi:hypothetical protein